MNWIGLLLLAVAACEEHGSPGNDARPIDSDIVLVDSGFSFDGTIDAPVGGNPGFFKPPQVIAAWTESPPGTFTAATLDLSCLGAARNDPATTVAVSVTATVRDFQNDNVDPGAGVTAFAGVNLASTLASATANGSGVATLTIPAGTKRFGTSVTAASSRTTLTFDTLLAPSTAAQPVTVRAVSNATASTLPALVGLTATSTGTLELGTITDCQGHTLSGAIATVSAVAGTPSHLPGVNSFYFSESVGLPVGHTQVLATTKNGLFMVLEVPQVTIGFIQVWGFLNPGQLASGTLTLIAQLGVPVPSSSALITRHDPRATQ